MADFVTLGTKIVTLSHYLSQSYRWNTCGILLWFPCSAADWKVPDFCVQVALQWGLLDCHDVAVRLLFHHGDKIVSFIVVFLGLSKLENWADLATIFTKIVLPDKYHVHSYRCWIMLCFLQKLLRSTVTFFSVLSMKHLWHTPMIPM